MRQKKFAVLAIIGVLSLAGEPVEAAQGPATPPLTGEVLLASSPDFIGTSELSGTCDPTGESKFSFKSTGEAVGPYPGTFTESGTFTLGPAIPSPGTTSGITFTPLAFDSSYTIDSRSTTITGTKTLTALLPFPIHHGGCGENTSFGAPPNAAFIQVNVSYTAQIRSPSGTSVDSGESRVDYSDLLSSGVETVHLFRFLEYFASTSFIEAVGGRAAGGGQIAPSVTFGFVAMSDEGGLNGHCQVVDHALSVNIDCETVSSYVQTANHATFSGRALVNGVETTYRIDVDDGGEPGSGDTFAIQTDSGYVAAGPLTGGDIQVHE